MKYSAVIFDLDGTLLDTLEDLAESCNFAMKSCGFKEHSIEAVRSFVGNGYSRLIELAVPDGKNNPLYQQALKAGKDYYSKNWQNRTKPYEGILSLVSELNAAGIKTGIVSNKPDAEVKKLAALYFPKQITEETAIGEKEAEGIRRKPFPDSVNRVLEILRVKKENALYVGDSEVDIETARNASIDCLSVSWGFREKSYLIEKGAVHIADTIQEAKDFIFS
ncbi:MAG: HAD family hydrolase [Treponema sp.]|nr:HAD family hydrolase [Candidatus Treponema caballi]